MGNNLQPPVSIETRYNGYRFRSRLEARVAVLFDLLHINYEYESQGYVLPNGETYLPDFYLPDFDYFVEAKGFSDYWVADIAKAMEFTASKRTNMFFIGEIPYIPDTNGIYLFKAVHFCPLYGSNKHQSFGEIAISARHGKPPVGFVWDSSPFMNNGVSMSWHYTVEQNHYDYESYKFMTHAHVLHEGENGFKFVQNVPQDPALRNFLQQAFRTARETRFEHGETPFLQRKEAE